MLERFCIVVTLIWLKENQIKRSAGGKIDKIKEKENQEKSIKKDKREAEKKIEEEEMNKFGTTIV